MKSKKEKEIDAELQDIVKLRKLWRIAQTLHTSGKDEILRKISQIRMIEESEFVSKGNLTEQHIKTITKHGILC